MIIAELTCAVELCCKLYFSASLLENDSAIIGCEVGFVSESIGLL